MAERLRDGRFPQGFGEQGDGEIKGFVLRESERQGRRGRIAEQPERDGVVPPVPVEREHDGQIERLPEAEPFDAGKGQAEQDVPRDMLQEVFPSGRGGLAPDGRQFLGCPCGGPVPFQQAGKQPVVPLRIQDAAHDEVLRIREGEFRSVQHGLGKGAAAERIQNPGGTVQPVEQLGKLLKAKAPKALFHIDAVQGLCRVRLTPKKWNCDLMSVSGHKIGAPKGIGALYVKKGLRLPPLTFGGGQERSMRPGTEAVPNIAAFAKACEIRMAHFDEDYAHVQELADYLKQQVSAELPDAVINGEGDIPHVVNLSMPGCKSEVMLHVLEGDEVYISSGSACSKGKQSGVLKALGLPKARTDSALRVSFAPFNTKEDVDAFVAAVKKGAKMFRR